LRRGRKNLTAPSKFPCAAMAAATVPAEYVSLANELVDAAGAITTRYFRTKLEIDDKNDASPVTIADRDAESAMRALVKRNFPDHAIFGEEMGVELGAGGAQDWCWVFDPIDGTKSFITGKPLWGTLVSLLHHGKPVLGILDQPVLKERWVGIDGERTTLNGAPIATRPCENLKDAYMYATTPLMFEGANEAPYQRVAASVKVPMYGCDCYAYGLLAAGFCDLVVEADLKPYDYMALVPIVIGAGGAFTDWDGHDLVWQGSVDAIKNNEYQGEVCAAGDAETHKQALVVLKQK
jgi:inositol-phosphate phosphatase/L-galactose 1-phosphate phosphatase/histidinol-phosphatase